MKLPEAVTIQFMIEPDTFNSVGQLEMGLKKFFEENGLEAIPTGPIKGQGYIPIMWLKRKKVEPELETPKGTPIKLGQNAKVSSV